MKPDISLAGFINSLSSILKLRNVILILGILFSLVMYYLIADYYTPFKNVLNYWDATDEVYTFFSGSKGGFYHEIGEDLNKLNTSKDEFEHSNIRIEVTDKTSGGLDNAIQVLSKRKSFGLIQESTLSSNDELRDKINYVSPLYMERLHIICKRSLFDEKDLKGASKELSPDNTELTRLLFKDRSISIGEVGSGTRVVSSYLLDVLEAEPGEINSYSQRDGLEALKNDEIEVFIVIVGAPLNIYSDILHEDSDYQLIGISPTLTLEINDKFSTNYRVSNFKKKYKSYEDINTLGSYCYLISSKDVDERINIEMLRRIAFIAEPLQERLEIEDSEEIKFQLEEIDFRSGVDSRETDINMEMYKSIGLFIISLLFSTFFAVWLLIWIFSSIKMARYFRLITRVYKDYYPEAASIDKYSSSVYLGNLPTHGSNQINELIKGIDSLRRLKKDVRADYDTGGISESHFRNLLSSTQIALEEFRSALARAITNDVKQNNKNKSYLTNKEISNFFASSYLDSDQYKMLLEVVK